MLRYIAVRTLLVFITVFVVLSMVFVLYQLAPHEPPIGEPEAIDAFYYAEVEKGNYTQRFISETSNPDEYNEIFKQVNSNDKECDKCHYIFENNQDGKVIRAFEPVPVAALYFNWLGKVVTKWDWGTSTGVKINEPSFSLVFNRIPVVLQLNLVALFLFVPLGFIFGIIAALRKDTLLDNIITIGVMMLISIPTFVIGTLLLGFFGYGLGWFNTQYVASHFALSSRVSSMVLPIVSLTLTPLAGLTRLMRAELSEVLTSEYLLLARTKGLTKKQSVLRHAMRNSMVPLVPTIIGSFVMLLFGSTVIERVYGIPGTGTLILDALSKSDYNVMLASTAFYTTVSLFSVLLVDLLYGVVDPRIRMGARK